MNTPLAIGQRRRWKGLPDVFGLPHNAEGLEFIVEKIGPSTARLLGCRGSYITSNSETMFCEHCYADQDFFEKYSVLVGNY